MDRTESVSFKKHQQKSPTSTISRKKKKIKTNHRQSPMNLWAILKGLTVISLKF